MFQYAAGDYEDDMYGQYIYAFGSDLASEGVIHEEETMPIEEIKEVEDIEIMPNEGEMRPSEDQLIVENIIKGRDLSHLTEDQLDAYDDPDINFDRSVAIGKVIRAPDIKNAIVKTKNYKPEHIGDYGNVSTLMGLELDLSKITRDDVQRFGYKKLVEPIVKHHLENKYGSRITNKIIKKVEKMDDWGFWDENFDYKYDPEHYKL